MAYINTGFKRSMKVTVTKTGNDDSVVATTYDGQGAFGIYTAIASDDDFRQLERNGVDGAWDIRLAAFKSYVLSEVGADVYALINWDDQTNGVVVSLLEYNVKIMNRAGGQGEVLAVVYLNDNTQSVLEDLFILLSFTGGAQNEQFVIPAGQYYSNTYSMTQLDIDLSNVSAVSISPTASVNGIYSIVVDTVNEF